MYRIKRPASSGTLNAVCLNLAAVSLFFWRIWSEGHSLGSLIHMYHLRRREAVKECAASGGVGAHVLGVDQFTQFHIGKLFSQTDGVEGVTGGTEHRTDLSWAVFETLEMILAMVKNHSAIGVVDTVVEVVTAFAAANRLADDLGDGGGGGGNQEPPRFGKNLDRFGKKPVQLSIDCLGEVLERRDRVIVMRGKASPDIEQLEIKAPRLGLGEDPGGQMQGLSVVLHVGALAADVKAQSLDFELVIVSKGNQVHRVPRQSAEFA